MTKETQQKKKHGETRVDLAFGISLGEWAVASIVGIGSGIAAAVKTIRDRFHDDVKNSTDFEAFLKHKQEALDQIKLAGCSREDFYTYAKATATAKRDWATAFDDLAFKQRGVRKNPILGTIDRFFTLSPRSKNSLYFNTTVGVIVGAAMTLSFFNGVATRDKIERIEDAVSPKEPGR